MKATEIRMPYRGQLANGNIYVLPIEPYWNLPNYDLEIDVPAGIFQSNHTGIETLLAPALPVCQPSFQSNHTGIETKVR